MKRLALWAVALALASVVTVGQANAQHRGFDHGGFHGDFRFRHDFDDFRFRRDFDDHRHFFFHRGFHRFHHAFFRPFFFFGTAAFAPVPVALYPPMPYPSYITGPDAAGGSCYQFQTSIMIDNQLQPAWGIACRQPDGSWRIVG